jgi:hypothetical protein
MTAKNVLLQPRSNGDALQVFNLILCPALSAFCFWHAFKGKNPLLGKSEQHTSLMLGLLSLIVGVGLMFAWQKYHHNAPELFTAFVFYAAAGFFFRQALQERQLGGG